MTSDSSNPECLLLTRPGCCLCDEADELLRRHGLTPKIVNIDEHGDLNERYTNCVPVVFLDGKRRFTGKVDERLLKRLLVGRR
jgi:glutaredoxin